VKQRASEFVHGVPELASLPAIYQRVNRIIAKQSSSAEEIGEVVGTDPSLTARLLRLVNSSFFSFPGQIETISRAIALIGTEQLRDLALATSVIEMFEDIPSECVDMKSYWRHSVATGVCARVLANLLREDNVERFFVAGLLHDLGSVIIYVRGGSKVRRLMTRVNKNQELLHKAERVTFGFDHADVGRELLALWKLPDVLRDAVNCHHVPSRSKRFPTEATVVHIADAIVDAMEIGTNGENFVPPIDETAWDDLGLPVDLLAEIIEEVDLQFEAAEYAMLSDL